MPKDHAKKPAVETKAPHVATEPATALPSAAALRVVKERFDDDYMHRIVTQYYGEIDDSDVIIKRLYTILAQMYEGQESLDIDEAARRDYHQHPTPQDVDK